MATSDSGRPMPPSELFADPFGSFMPSSQAVDWIFNQIIDPAGSLHNPDHLHLTDAIIGVLWTSCGNVRQGRQVLGQTEIPMFRCGAWQKARQELQLRQWFGVVPDFIITLDAHFCEQAEDSEFCALVEHELYHCGQEMDAFGLPKFRKSTGLPAFAIRGHDVEEFVGVVRRYGIGRPDSPLADMVRAAADGPEVARVNIARSCGTCMLKVA